MTTNQIISARILTKVAEGMDLKDAINEVLGAGTFEQLVGDLYDALRRIDVLESVVYSSPNA